MDYRCSGERELTPRPITSGAIEAIAPSRSRERLRVLILGREKMYSPFHAILTTNIRRWGYEAVLLPALADDSSVWHEMEGDILLYDMDVSLQPMRAWGEMGSGIASSTGVHQVSFRPLWPQVRLSIVLSSRSVSRLSLEQMGAIALLQKPFDLRHLERYLRVFQKLLYAETESGERVVTRPQRSGNRRFLFAGEEHSESTPPLERGGHARILVADDRREVTRTVRQCLIEQENQRYHYEVREVHDGLELLEQCLSWQPHCVVTDLLMPWLNGYQVMHCLADNLIQPSPVFVVMSALMQHEVPAHRSELQDQVVLYVEKPFEVENLLAVIEQALAK